MVSNKNNFSLDKRGKIINEKLNKGETLLKVKKKMYFGIDSDQNNFVLKETDPFLNKKINRI